MGGKEGIEGVHGLGRVSLEIYLKPNRFKLVFKAGIEIQLTIYKN